MSTTTQTRKAAKNRKKNEPRGFADLERIAAELDRIGRRHLPDGVIRHGILGGYEAEIRQEALIMAVGGFLERSAGFRDASAMGDDEAVSTAMERCMAIALKIAKKRMASRLSHAAARVQVTVGNGGSCQHPSQRHPHHWPPDLKAQMIMRAVVTAVRADELSVANASIVSMICEQGMSAEDVATAVGITRSAVYQQLHRVRRVIPDMLELIEMPLM